MMHEQPTPSLQPFAPRELHVCHVITRLIIGGAQENTILSCKGLVEAGYRVTLIAGEETGPEGSLWPAAEASGAELIRLPSLVRAIAPVTDVSCLSQLIRLFRRIKPGIVHTHSSKAGIIGREAAKAARVSAIVHTVHGMSFNRTQGFLTRWAYRAMERRAAKLSDRIISVANAMTSQSLAAGVGKAEQYITIRSGMEIDQFRRDDTLRQEVRQSWGVDDDLVVVGTVARLFRNKGYEEILQAMPKAMQQNPRLRFVWVGDGAHRSDYEAQLRSIGLRDKVHIVGLVPPTEIPRQINGFDILLHASQWEGLPRAVVQGLLCEKPAISFDNDGAPEVVIPKRTGLLVPLGDIDCLAEAIVTLSRDESLRAELGRAGRAACLIPFDWRTMVARLDEQYRLLTQQTAANRG